MNRELFSNERSAWIFLNQIPELGPVRFHRLLYAAKSALGILEMSVAGLQAAEVPPGLAERWYRAFRDPGNHRWLDSELSRLTDGRYQVVTELDAGYPERLRELFGRPPVLYFKGNWPPPVSKVVGIVGTREPSRYGRSVAEKLTLELCSRGIATISGLARGIDTVAHEATLRAQQYTAAVLGCGLRADFNRASRALQERIVESGAVVSEFPLGMPAQRGNFPRRNRIISGLSEGVVVIEAGERSGALITARYAAEQGRDVFAVPGSIFEPMSVGCHKLIREGAKLITQSADILEEFGLMPLPPALPLVPKPIHFDTLSPLEIQIAELLSENPLSADEISITTAQRFEQVATSLLSLELKGIIRPLPGQRYARI